VTVLVDAAVLRTAVEDVFTNYVGQEGRGGANGVQKDVLRLLDRALIDGIEAERLRRFLWLNHGHAAVLYGDDGEMQCKDCIPTWDYLRAPIRDVLAAAEKAISPWPAMTLRETRS
jgi:hypothetical protein